MDPFQDILRYGRKLKNITQRVLGEKIGASKQLILMYENGLRLPTKNNLELLCKELDLDYNYMAMLVACQKYNIKTKDFEKHIIIYNTKEINTCLNELEKITSKIDEQLKNYQKINNDIINLKNNIKRNIGGK